MTEKLHSYAVTTTWTGNLGQGTKSYAAFSRNHEIRAAGKPVLDGSSDPAFRGDPARYNPEELLVSALSTCHMLWYLHLCSDAGIVVTAYEDHASGTMVETKDGGHFTEVVLKPCATLADFSRADAARELHDRAHHFCYVANSVNFPVRCAPEFTGA